MRKIRFNWGAVVLISLFTTLLTLVMTAAMVRKTNDSYFTKQRLKDDEILIIWFREPIEERLGDNPDLHITNDDINWYSVTNDYFVLDYKYDPGTFYINIDFIAIWGIER